MKWHPLICTCLISSFLLSCTDSSSPDSIYGKTYYSYGDETFSGVLSALDENYVPSGLDPKLFSQGGFQYAPLDIVSQDLTLVFDVKNLKVTGSSTLSFRQSAKAYSLFQLNATNVSAKLNGHPVHLSRILDPDGLNQTFWSVDSEVSPTAISELELAFELPADRVTFADGGVRFLTDMTDLYDARFLEQWAPTGLEQDAFKMKVSLRVVNGTSPQRLTTNGRSTQLSNSDWLVDFPNYFTTSSFYMHLTNNPALNYEEFSISGVENEIPIVLYSQYPHLISQAKAQLHALFKEFELDFGPYPHEKFVVYLNGRSGGMEYSGATITSVSALDHELFHSWFGRSVLPAEGRSGWIDEAFASWRDHGYFQSPSLLWRAPTSLSNFSPFRKSTPANCYRDGRQMISELDRMFAAYGGMKPLMRSFFERYKNRVITNEEFWKFLNDKTEMKVDPFFERYTLGGNTKSLQEFSLTHQEVEDPIYHPNPLTRAEVLDLR